MLNPYARDAIARHSSINATWVRLCWSEGGAAGGQAVWLPLPFPGRDRGTRAGTGSMEHRPGPGRVDVPSIRPAGARGRAGWGRWGTGDLRGPGAPRPPSLTLKEPHPCHFDV